MGFLEWGLRERKFEWFFFGELRVEFGVREYWSVCEGLRWGVLSEVCFGSWWFLCFFVGCWCIWVWVLVFFKEVVKG